MRWLCFRSPLLAFLFNALVCFQESIGLTEHDTNTAHFFLFLYISLPAVWLSSFFFWLGSPRALLLSNQVRNCSCLFICNVWALTETVAFSKSVQTSRLSLFLTYLFHQSFFPLRQGCVGCLSFHSSLDLQCNREEQKSSLSTWTQWVPSSLCFSVSYCLIFLKSCLIYNTSLTQKLGSPHRLTNRLIKWLIWSQAAWCALYRYLLCVCV